MDISKEASLMKQLYYYEGKKFFHSWLHRCLILFLFLFPILDLTLQYTTSQNETMLLNGERISGIEAEQITDEIRNEHQGTIDPVWLDQVEKEYKELAESGIDEQDVRYLALSSVYWDGVNKYRQRLGLLSSDDVLKEIKEEINEATLKYGAYAGWSTRIEILEHCALVYLVVCVLLCSDLFNQEDHNQMMEPLKACKQGRSGLAIAKLVVALVVCVSAGILMFTIAHLMSGMLLDMQGGSTTIMNQVSSQIHSYQSVYWQAFCLMMIAGVASILCSAFISSICKKQTTSLLIAVLFLLLPFIFNPIIAGIPITRFFPTNFTYFTGIARITNTTWVVIQDHAFHWLPIMGCVWGIGTLILILFTYWNHVSDHKWLMYRK